MSDDDRFDRLERRLLVLEEIIRKRLPPTNSPEPRTEGGKKTVLQLPLQGREVPVLRRAMPSSEIPQASGRDLLEAIRKPQNVKPPEPLGAEQWIGQRGFLGIGVLLLLLGGVYFLKVAIDKGWISPAERCALSVVVGHGLAVVGWRLYRRGVETFGATIIGAGSGFIYLGIWAASRWYGMISPELGMAGLLYAGFATSAIAFQLDNEALGVAAALGSLLGPIVISTEIGHANALLLYLLGVGATLGVMAGRREWRVTTNLIVVTGIMLGFQATSLAKPLYVLEFAVLTGLGCFSLRRRWAETMLIGVFGGWACLLQMPSPPVNAQLLGIGGVLLSLPVWWSALARNVVWPDANVAETGGNWSFAESLLFYTTPALLAGLVYLTAHDWLLANLSRFLQLLAVPYLAIGYFPFRVFRGSRAPFAVIGITFAGLAALAWPGDGVFGTVALLVMAMLWSGLDHLQKRFDGRWYTLLMLAMTAARFITIIRAPNGAAFRDSWALVWYGMIAVTVVLALGFWRRGRPGEVDPADLLQGERVKVLRGSLAFLDNNRTLAPQIPALLWVAAGVMLFAGVTSELGRFIGQMGLTPDVVLLASGLAVSAWWALYSGCVVMFGFYRGLKSVRSAGLMVASLAVVKVLLFDLANLDQLYRVASFIFLAVVLLLVAYVYNRPRATEKERS